LQKKTLQWYKKYTPHPGESVDYPAPAVRTVSFEALETGAVDLSIDGLHIINVILLDSSGSMRTHGKAPEEAVNQAIASMRMLDNGRHYVAVVSFDDQPRVLLPITPVAEATFDGYRADGNTTLYLTVDGVLSYLLSRVRTIQRTNPSAAARLKVALGVFSDGGDNPPATLREMNRIHPAQLQASARAALETDNFDLQTLGIGISGDDLARMMGFPVGSPFSHTLARSGAGLRSGSHAFTRRSGTIGTMNFVRPPSTR